MSRYHLVFQDVIRKLSLSKGTRAAIEISLETFRYAGSKSIVNILRMLKVLITVNPKVAQLDSDTLQKLRNSSNDLDVSMYALFTKDPVFKKHSDCHVRYAYHLATDFADVTAGLSDSSTLIRDFFVSSVIDKENLVPESAVFKNLQSDVRRKVFAKDGYNHPAAKLDKAPSIRKGYYTRPRQGESKYAHYYETAMGLYEDFDWINDVPAVSVQILKDLVDSYKGSPRLKYLLKHPDMLLPLVENIITKPAYQKEFLYVIPRERSDNPARYDNVKAVFNLIESTTKLAAVRISTRSERLARLLEDILTERGKQDGQVQGELLQSEST